MADVAGLIEQRVVVRFTTAQRVEPDALAGEVDLASQEAADPMRVDRVLAAHHVDAAAVGGSSDEDHGSAQGCLEVQNE